MYLQLTFILRHSFFLSFFLSLPSPSSSFLLLPFSQVSKSCSRAPGTGSSFNSVGGGGGGALSLLGLLQELTLTTERRRERQREEKRKRKRDKKKYEYFKCIASGGIALRIRTTMESRVDSPRGPELNTIVCGVRVTAGTTEWLQIRSVDPQHHGKFIPLTIRGEMVFQSIADPTKRANQATTTATGTTTGTTTTTGPPINMRTVSGSLCDVSRSMARYPHVLGPLALEMADSDPWGGQGYFTETPAVHAGSVRSVTLQLAKMISETRGNGYASLEVHVYEKDRSVATSSSSRRGQSHVSFRLVGIGNIRVKNEADLIQTVPILGGALCLQPRQYLGLYCRRGNINVRLIFFLLFFYVFFFHLGRSELIE